ncbi:MAG TPA: type II secretion system F family protein [Thermoflexia bacterium]|nr:type II secretion system F family protein [Thermoflexia bacterium]
MRYHYVAFNSQGQSVEGNVEVVDETAVERLLWSQGLTVAQISAARAHRSLAELFPTFFGLKRGDLIIFSRQLATMLRSGISILAALQMLAQQVTKPALHEILQDIIATLRAGQPFSSALAHHPHAFPIIYQRTIMVGEHTGNLDVMLQQLAIYFKKEQSLIRKMRDAMIYPLFVVAVAIFVIILMFTIALPPMIALFDSFDAELPWSTRALIATSKFITAYGFYLLLGGLLLSALLGWWGTQPSGRRLRDRLLLRIPLVGRVILLGQVCRFTNTSAMLIRAGIPLAEAIDLSRNTITNTVLTAALSRVRNALLAGRGLADPLSAESVFPPLLAQMVRVGEESGTLEENLKTLTEFYEEETDHKVQQLITAVEPTLTIITAILVGFIAISMVTPMYSVLSEIK